MKIFLSLAFFITGFLSIKAQQYKPVDEKSKVNFTIKNFGVNTNGTFSGLKGTILFDSSKLSTSSFNVSVDVNTINSGIDMRDSHLKKEEYFYAEKYSNISFVSTGIKLNNEGYVVTGQLTIKGISKEISFPFTAVSKKDGMLFTGDLNINRKDFDIGGGSAVMGSNVDISLKIFAQ